MREQHFVADTAALRATADRFDAGAEIIDHAVRHRLDRLRFSGVSAGRVHLAAGNALRQALDRWAGELAQWSRASAEIGAALRSGAQGYAEAESRSTARVR